MQKFIWAGKLLSLLAPLLAALASGGCVGPRAVARNAVSFNLAVEEAQNEMLLLNAIRASKRRPMYITGISQVTGSVRRDLAATVRVPFGGIGAGRNESTTGAVYSVSPSFVVPVLDTQEFMQGFLKPVPNQILAYLWDQGWPRSLLLHLLVHRVRVRQETLVEGHNRIEVQDYFFNNYPNSQDENLCELQKFSRFIHFYLDPEASGPRFETAISFTKLDPVLSFDQIGGMSSLISASKDGFEVVEEVKAQGTAEAKKYRILRREKSPGLFVKDQKRLLKFAREEKDNPPCASKNTEPDFVSFLKDPGAESSPQGDLKSIDQSASADSSEKENKEPVVSVEFFIRSPEAVLYYLGELTRFQDKHEEASPKLCIQGFLQPMFVARRLSGACRTGIVNAEFEGEEFLIPRASREIEEKEKCKPIIPHGGDKVSVLRIEESGCVAGRSMQALSLLNQLIALQKSAKDLPGTSLVRTIGQ